jgi:hypothetical protein
LGGRKTKPVRSKVREESSGKQSGRVLNFKEGFVSGKVDLKVVTRLEQGGLRVERKKTWMYRILDHLPLKWQKLSKSRTV